MALFNIILLMANELCLSKELIKISTSVTLFVIVMYTFPLEGAFQNSVEVVSYTNL